MITTAPGMPLPEAKPAVQGVSTSCSGLVPKTILGTLVRCSKGGDGGHLGILQRTVIHPGVRNWRTCSGAAAGRHLTVFQWVRANGAGWQDDAANRATEGGNWSCFSGHGPTSAP